MAGHSWSKFLPPRFSPSDPTKFTPRINPDDGMMKHKEALLSVYDTPSNKDMLVILPFFNPCNSLRMTQNLLLIKDKLDASNIPYTIIHALYPSSAPLGLKENYSTVHTTSYAFIKENLANLIIDAKKDEYAKFCVLDGDIVFKRSDWYVATSDALDRYIIVQPFTDYVNLGQDFTTPLKEGRGILAQYQKPISDENGDIGDVQGHTGYCIAFTRMFLRTVGYPELNLLGGGDMIVCSVALGIKLFSRHGHKKYYDFVYDKHSPGRSLKWGVVSGGVYHLYHGDSANRQYVSRYSILYKYLSQTQNDGKRHLVITDIVKKNKEGVYEWIDEIKEDINKDVLSYFASREDDS